MDRIGGIRGLLTPNGVRPVRLSDFPNGEFLGRSRVRLVGLIRAGVVARVTGVDNNSGVGDARSFCTNEACE